MAIQNRRGEDLWFDSTKMLPGEFAVSTDEKKVYVAFAPGDVREFAFQDQIPIVGDITPDKLQEAVNNYLADNPVQPGASESEKKQIEKNKQSIECLSNPNLLINGEFQVWQRGEEFTNIYSEEGIYCADRWMVRYNDQSELNIVKTDTGLSVSNSIARPCTIAQPLEQDLLNRFAEKTLTLSYGVTNDSGYNEHVKQIVVPEDAISITFAFEYCGIELNNGDTLNWAKLEVGIIATPIISRLYGEELFLCQRYYQTVHYPTKFYGGLTNYWEGISFPPMRIVPTIVSSEFYNPDATERYLVEHIFIDNEYVINYILLISSVSAVRGVICLDAEIYLGEDSVG